MTNDTIGKSPEEKTRDAQKSRRKTRQEIWTVFIGISSAFIPLASLLGTSPIAKVWSGLFLVLAAFIIFSAIWVHHRGEGIKELFRIFTLQGFAAARKTRLLYAISVIVIIFCTGIWFGASGRNAISLLINGNLDDLSIRPAKGVSEAAIITLRREYSMVCFSTRIIFDVSNVSGQELLIGLISNTVSMTDNVNSPLFSSNYPADITSSGASVSGVQLVKGSAETWYDKIEQKKGLLSSLHPGSVARVAVSQNRNGNLTCVSDLDGSALRNYRGSVVRLFGEFLIVYPDGSWKRQNINFGDVQALVDR